MAHFVYVDFDPSDFNFVTTIKDDGQDEGGGWQEARAKLKFKSLNIPHKVTSWSCAFTIGMPLRTVLMGRIDPSLAASFSEDVTEEVANRMDYELPPGIFCEKFILAARAAFKSKYKGLGATVTK
ncbi:hypothetical protein BE15_11325 [Sorangium cellulosum]|uniref:Uncharacterized protein n=1 Tax=Sorangium cellulosum TaxID=56 RepID=A0A150QGU8_SORCE|nr:hypothetical protein BE15_11325 [Sorangium cellulosum]